MKKILAIVLMTLLLVTPALASGEATAEAAAEVAVEAAPAAEPACNHAFTVEKTVEETCTEKGLVTYTCSKCELTYTVETLPTGHAASAAAATCTDDVVCLNCGEVLEAAIGHAYTYQMDAVVAEDGSYVSYGTWACDNCGDVIDATEGNAVYYYGQAAEATGSSEEASAEAAAETVVEEAAVEVANPNYDPYAYNWASICITIAIVIVVVGAALMLSFGKKKKD